MPALVPGERPPVLEPWLSDCGVDPVGLVAAVDVATADLDLAATDDS
jgi:hypothetical protein